jgi:sec-independent protein translocase protein TatA
MRDQPSIGPQAFACLLPRHWFLRPGRTMFGLTFQEMLVVGIIAIVLFGSKLPEVARMLGQQYAKFRRSLNELQAQVNLHEIYDPRPTSITSSKSSYSSSYSSFDDHDEATAPRFEPPPEEKASGPNSDAA